MQVHTVPKMNHQRWRNSAARHTTSGVPKALQGCAMPERLAPPKQAKISATPGTPDVPETTTKPRATKAPVQPAWLRSSEKWPRWIETATRTRSRLLQEDVETTLRERSSDSVPVSIHEIYEEQSWKWRPDEVDDKISDWWKKTGRIMDGSFARIRSDVSSYSSWSCCSKTKA